MKKILTLSLLIISLLIISVNAQVSPLDETRMDRLNFGHTLIIQNISVGELSQGKPAVLKLVLENSADFYLRDIRIDLNLPSGISFVDDVSRKKIADMEAREVRELTFNIVASPDTSEGVYDGSIMTYYLNHMGTERTDNNTFSIIVKSSPELFAKIDNSELYKGNGIGDVTITFVNNGVADIKFLTVELKSSPDYYITSTNKEYIGDLDSDDFESIDFSLKLTSEKDEIILPLNLHYKDALNNDYSQDIELMLKIRTAEELGKKSNTTTWVVIIIIMVIILGFMFYRSRKKKKSNHFTKDGLVIPLLEHKTGNKKKR